MSLNLSEHNLSYLRNGVSDTFGIIPISWHGTHVKVPSIELSQKEATRMFNRNDISANELH